MATITTTATVTRKPLYTSLFVQVLTALLLGIVVGMAVPDFAIGLKIFSDVFLKLISMIVPPIVFCVVVHGIAGAGDLKKVGRVGVKALIYFEVMTTVALIVGLLLAYLFGPGHGMNIDPSTLDPKALNTYADNAHKLQGGGIGSFLINIIPTTSFDALARNDVLQVLFFAIIFGISLALVGGEKGERINSLVDAVSTVLFRAMGLIVRLAPLGVLGAVAYTVGQYGVGSLRQLVSLVALFYVSLAIFVLGVLGGVMALAGLNILKFLSYLREELTIVLATASSDAVLPQIMRKLTRLGVKDSVVGLVIPTGYSFNLDAFSIYLTLAVVFIAQATNTPLSLGDLLLVLGVSLITSKGAHGVPGSAIVILAATLNAAPSIPAIGLVLVLSVDWFIGMARALGNLIGNCVATVVVAAWEGDLDRAKAQRVLEGEELVDVTAGEGFNSAVDFEGLSEPANATGVPTAPAHASETLKVRCERSLGSPLMGSDASLGFHDLSLQLGYGSLRLTARTGDIAHPKPSDFQGLHGVTVLLQLNPVPGDVAMAVSNHLAAAAIDLSKPLGTSISTSSVDTCVPLSILTMTFSGSSVTCRETTARISARSSPNNSG